ncbi:MAG: hypothetical protein AAF317_12085 [Pseudomonadota bacterium]
MVSIASLGGLLDPGFRQAAACVIESGTELKNIDAIAPLVATVDLQMAREEASAGTITIEDRRREDGTWIAADSGLFSRWAPIRISADFQTHQEVILTGYIVDLKPEYPGNAGEAKLTLEVQDEGAALSRTHLRKVFGDPDAMSDLEILKELIKDADLSADSASADGQKSRSLTVEGTPIQFLRERAQANGYELIFSEGEVYFGPKRLEGSIQSPILVYAGRATNCRTFNLGDKADLPDLVQVDLAQREEGAETETTVVGANEPVLGSSPAAAEGAGLGTPHVWRVGHEGDETPEEATARAQGLVNEHAFKLRGSGELDGSLYGHVLRPGRMVTIDGPGTRYGGIYYVDKVAHAFNTEGYTQTFDVMRNATGETDAPSSPLSAATSAIGGLFSASGLSAGLG